MSKVKIVGTGIGFCLIVIAGWEALRTEAYRDIGGVPTICYGETHGVQIGDVATPDQCRSMLSKRVQEYWDAVDRIVTAPMRPREHVAFTDLAYRIGVSAFAGSTLVRYANSGNMPAACLQIRKWVYDRQSRYHPDPVPGLVKRAEFDFQVCIGATVTEE